VAGDEEDALVGAFCPVSDAAIPHFAAEAVVRLGVEGPAQFTGGGIERDQAQFGSSGIEEAIHDDRIAFHFGLLKSVAGLESPGYLELGDIGTIDLVEGGIANAIGTTAVHSPLAIWIGSLEPDVQGCREN
jgi:hypothetical protein